MSDGGRARFLILLRPSYFFFPTCHAAISDPLNGLVRCLHKPVIFSTQITAYREIAKDGDDWKDDTGQRPDHWLARNGRQEEDSDQVYAEPDYREDGIQDFAPLSQGSRNAPDAAPRVTLANRSRNNRQQAKQKHYFGAKTVMQEVEAQQANRQVYKRHDAIENHEAYLR
jgi:hypothetical protein